MGEVVVLTSTSFGLFVPLAIGLLMPSTAERDQLNVVPTMALPGV
jgi:hypothetical protein